MHSLSQGWLPIHCAVAMSHVPLLETLLSEMSPAEDRYAEVFNTECLGEVREYGCSDTIVKLMK